MNVHKNLSLNKNSALALGFFDGIHIAHQELIKKTVALAKENNTKSILITFLKSPYSVISGTAPLYITKPDYKIKLIENLGVDDVYILDFNDFKNMKAENYIKDILLKYFNPKFIITGFNHTFGQNKEGNPNLLRQNSSYKYVEIQPVKISDILVSSTNIKNFIKEGNFELANKMLNRKFSIRNKVIKGAQIARQLGYKTANFTWDKEIVKPKYGVYFGSAKYKGVKYQALINFGIRPSVDKSLTETLEVHLVNFDNDLYNQELEVEFSSKLRDEIKFNSYEELKNQIDKDYKKLLSSL